VLPPLKLGEDVMPEFAQGSEAPRLSELWQGVPSNPMFAAWNEAGSAYLKACAAWQQEMSRFIGARVEADVTAQKSLAGCRNLADAAKLQQEWAASTVNDYFNEMGRLAEIASRCMPGCQAASGVTKEAPPRARVAS
jgi:hypothetical protein